MRFISIDKVRPGMTLGKTIYDSSLKLLLKENTVLTDRYLQRIKDLGYPGIYIEDELSKDIKIDDVISADLRIAAFQLVKAVCVHAYHYSKNNNKHAAEVNQQMQNIDNLSLRLITDLKTRNIKRMNLIDLKFFEDFIVSHNVNVAVLALFMGIHLGFSTVELQRLGSAALLLDVGKMFLDPKLLNKTSKLTNEEFQQINMHSTYSYRYVKEAFHVHPSVYLGILYHHEKVDGTGYPKQKTGNDIPLFSRILAICDVYDALTSSRPNRRSLPPFEAIEFLMANGGSQFDMRLLKLFTQLVAPYPKGIEVELSNGEVGIVLDNTKDVPLRPLVRVYKNADGPYEKVQHINLKDDSNYLNVTIIGLPHIQ